MDIRRTDGAGSPNVQVSAHLTENNTTVSNAAKEKAKDEPVVEALNMSSYPKLSKNFRAVISPLEGLQKFIRWQRKKLDMSSDECFRDALKFDSSLKDTIEDLVPVFSKGGLDLISLLKGVLKKSNNIEEKVILLKTFYSLERQDELLDEYFLPALEKRNGFENAENNHDFCIQFLTAIKKKDFEKLLNTIDFNKITKINDFARSLIVIRDPYEVLDMLVLGHKASCKDCCEDDSLIAEKEKNQKVALEIIHILKGDESFVKDSSPIPLRHLKAMYKKSANKNIYDEVSKLLREYSLKDAMEIFRDQLVNNNSNGEDDKQRYKSFYATSQYAHSARENAAQTLKEFIYNKNDTDQFLTGSACYELANNCGVDGMRALVDVIVKQVRENKLSIPLASITQLAKFDNKYSKVLLGVLSKTFHEERDLKQAYLNLANIDLSLIFRNDKGIIWFQLSPSERRNLSCDLVDYIGLETFEKWAAFGEGKTPEIRKNIKANALDILESAWLLDEGRMNQLLLEKLTASCEDSEEHNLFKKLAGISGLGKALAD
ncbi:MAG: hypothetical protein HY094_04715 [Candidatus Melainabacteria bacterium]|nr:hypothetical protein [Candidatus Melainabacteria bacterium]